jgi:uncharacterized protein YprB with RNaseH-like and TPR domain
VKAKLKWQDEELEVLEKYFNNSWNMQTVVQRIQAINPNRTHEAISRKIRQLKSTTGVVRPREHFLKSLRYGYLDIEVSDLQPKFGYMLSWCIKPRGSSKIDKGMITKKEVFNYSFDKRILTELLECFDSYDILYTWYGGNYRFDVPYIRSRTYHHQLEDLLPAKNEVYMRDLYPIVKSRFKLHSYSLKNVGKALNIIKGEKIDLTSEEWIKARLGDKACLKKLMHHNENDVVLLEEIHNIIAEKIENPNLLLNTHI